MKIVNHTPFAVGQTVLLDKDGAETLVMAIGASFDISEQGGLTPVAAPLPLTMVDEFYGEPDTSSIRQEAEFGPSRPRTDVFLRADAVARHPETRSIEVSYRVGPLSTRAIVSGPRVWRRRLGFSSISDPEPFERVPLIWENAFGGADLSPKKEKHRGFEPRNPVGRGFFAKRSRADWIGQELPQIEAPDDRLHSAGQRVRPVGFGPIGRHWEPRVRYAGSYDETWQRERIPLLPHDFDERFHNAAPPELVASGRLLGDEPVEVLGCTGSGVLRFDLPGLRARAEVRLRRDPLQLDLPLESVGVDTNSMKLRLIFKASLRIHGEAMRLKNTEFFAAGPHDQVSGMSSRP